MPMAVFHDGEIRPLEPLPSEWREGQRLRVESAESDDSTVAEIDRDFDELAELCANSDPSDEARLAHALLTARDQSKAQVRRQMGIQFRILIPQPPTRLDAFALPRNRQR